MRFLRIPMHLKLCWHPFPILTLRQLLDVRYLGLERSQLRPMLASSTIPRSQVFARLRVERYWVSRRFFYQIHLLLTDAELCWKLEASLPMSYSAKTRSLPRTSYSRGGR